MNILVIDDEPLIHISIEKLILSCQDAFGPLEVFHAYTGAQMLNQLKERSFQLAYVDIKMPGLTGLEAIRLGREISPDTRYYIMTGFNEFEYAKQAIKLKVEDYLMKPLDLKTIQETLRAAEAAEAVRLREQKTIFRNWLESVINRRESSLGKYKGYYGFVMLIAIDNSSLPPESLLEMLNPYQDCFVSSFTGNQILLLCFSRNSNDLHRMLMDLSAQTYTGKVSCFASSVTGQTEELKDDVSLLLEHSCLRVLYGMEKFYYLNPLLSCPPELLQFASLCVQWQSACLQKDYSRFTNCSELICRRLEHLEDREKYQRNIFSFFAAVLHGEDPIPSQPDSLGRYFREYAKQFLHASEDSRPAQAIVRYINEHYCEDLSIASLSEQFGFSANYISNLLKQELGISYNKYISQLRMNRAKELLLSTSQSVKEITAACGYYSQSHFTKLFMEHEGCTPTEFRRRGSNRTSQ